MKTGMLDRVVGAAALGVWGLWVYPMPTILSVFNQGFINGLQLFALLIALVSLLAAAIQLLSGIRRSSIHGALAVALTMLLLFHFTTSRFLGGLYGVSLAVIGIALAHAWKTSRP